MNPIDAIYWAFTKMFDYQGRATRPEYWWYFAFAVVFAPVVIAINATVGIVTLVALVLPWPAVMVRRLHDANYSGWMLLVWLVPVIGGIWILILLCWSPDDGANKYGEPAWLSDHLD